MKGREFKAVRERLGLSQNELAQLLCLSGKKAVSNIETEFRNASKLTVVLMMLFDELTQKEFKDLRSLILRNSEKVSGSTKRYK